MRLQIVKVGPLQTNCYLITEKKSKETLIVDAGAEPEKILPLLNGLKPVGIVLTHGHYDHVEDAHLIKEKYAVPVMVHQAEIALLAHCTNLKADRLLKDREVIKVGRLQFEVFHTPGHSGGGICLYCASEKVLFSGDTLFAGAWGRTDLPTGSEQEMRQSLKRLLSLPPETVVYPGHGQETTIGDERELIL